MLNEKEAKNRARILKTFLAEQGVSLSHGVLLEAVARTEHHKNWATFLAASHAEQQLTPSAVDVASWPVYVFGLDDEDCFATVFPQGGLDTLPKNQWGQTLDTQAQPVPAGFVFDANVAIQAVRAEVPSIDEYGLPGLADESNAPAWLREEFGVAVVEPLDITVHDRGDDGMGCFWVEARVHPDLAKQLPAKVPVKNTSEDLEVQAWRKVILRVFTDDAGMPVDSIMAALQRGLSSPVTRVVNGERYLQSTVNELIVLNGPYQWLSCGELFVRLKALAKSEFDRIALTKD